MECYSFVPVAVLLLGMLALASPLSFVPDFDVYYFSQLWPGTYCEQSKCCLPTCGYLAEDFLIRGLQPASSATADPLTKCSSDPFYKNELDGLKNDLDLYWSNIKCPRNNGLSAWKSTWKTYGTCSDLTQYGYFGTALAIRKKIHLRSILEHEGIIPSVEKRYELTSIETAIEKGVGAKARIRCNSKDQLYEVYICLTRFTYEPLDCPEDLRFTCASEIYFPPLNGTKVIVNQTLPLSAENFMARNIITPVSL